MKIELKKLIWKAGISEKTVRGQNERVRKWNFRSKIINKSKGLSY